MSRQIAVYGTLRKGSYNFDRFQTAFGEENVKHIKTVTVSAPFKMIGLYNNVYPGLVATKVSNDIVFDIIELSDVAYEAIDMMEKSSGYRSNTIAIEGNSFQFYQYFPSGLEVPSDINHNDWIKYEQDKSSTKAPNPFEETEI